MDIACRAHPTLANHRESQMIFKRPYNGTEYAAVFEDDGKEAYAYLLDAGSIVADVWLYNRIPAPERPEWPDRSKMPFANPLGFAASDPSPPVTNEQDVVFEWPRDPAQ